MDRAVSAISPVNGSSIPIYGGGGSDAAIAELAPRIDTFMVWGEPLADTARSSTACAPPGGPPATRSGSACRPVRSSRPAKGRRGTGQADPRRDPVTRRRRAHQPANVASQRLLDSAARSEVFDRCLWTPLAAATGAPGNSTALVGTPETVALAMADYVDLGATTLLIRGYNPLADAEDYGLELIPRVRQLVAERAAARAGAPPVRSSSAAPRAVAIAHQPTAVSEPTLRPEAAVRSLYFICKRPIVGVVYGPKVRCRWQVRPGSGRSGPAWSG